MATDKKISELPLANLLDGSDLSVMVSEGISYQFTFSALLAFMRSNLNVGANISFGRTIPPDTQGKNNDLFINTATGSFMQKLADIWTVVYTIPTPGETNDGTVLYGFGTPSPATGNENDTYINTSTGIFYKRTSGNWVQVFSMQTGPAGPTGANGKNGSNGTDGRTILYGSTDPSDIQTGTNGDFYINTSTSTLFGPKTADVWPAGIRMVGAAGPAGQSGSTGPAGQAGPPGQAGPGVAAGGSSGQVLIKKSVNDFDTCWANLPANDLSVLSTEIGETWNLRTNSRSTVEAINEIIASLTPFPTVRGLVEDFDPERADLVTVQSGKITNIKGTVAGISSSQSDSNHQPVYRTSGGPGNKPYFSFLNGYLTGNLILNGTEFTIYVIRKVDNVSSVTGPFYNGGLSDGYGFADGNTDGAFVLPGGYYQGATALAAHGMREYPGKWEAYAISHANGVNKFYNAVGLASFNYNPSTTNPNMPTGQHYIGYIPAQSYYTGGIGRILICNVQHSDAEVANVMDYFSRHYTIARPVVVHQIGDSISAGLGVAKSYPDQEIDQMQATGYYISLNNKAVSGRTSANCLNGFSAEVSANIVPSVKNIVQIMVGHNDLAANVDPASIYANITAMVKAAQITGVNVKVMLMTPLISTNETRDASKMSAWNALHALILANTAGADLVVDMQSLISMTNPSDANRYQDGIHPTALGATEIAAFIAPKAQSLLNSF